MGAGPNWVFGVCLGFDWTQMTATLRQLAARCGELRGASLSGGPICLIQFVCIPLNLLD